MYGTMIEGVEKTTVYLTRALKAGLARAARETGKSEAELIREGVQHVISRRRAPRPTIPLFSGGPGDLAENVDRYLEGFGED